MILLVPAMSLRPRRPDEHYAEEVAAAREAGLDVAFVDHDELTRPDGAQAAVSRVPRDAGRALYRGWMLTSGQYAALDSALRERGVQLVTSAAQYQRAHELPGWYQSLKSVTPVAEWSTDAGRDGFEKVRAALAPGAAVLRDYTKSAKHHWDEAVFIPDLSDADASWKVAQRFLEIREDDFTGGFVLRRFEEFGSAEVRTWWVGGACVLVGPHPDTPHESVDAPDPQPYASLIGGLDLPFVTLDLARRKDGVWRVIELGDGQVSDCPAALVAALVEGYRTL